MRWGEDLRKCEDGEMGWWGKGRKMQQRLMWKRTDINMHVISRSSNGLSEILASDFRQ
jgi:hypothetical protein